MELRTLRAFVEVVRQGGFSNAARTLAATQSTISKAVKQLEDELGVLLLDRLGHRTMLTPAGEVVHRRAIIMLAERDDLLTELAELRGLSRGVLRLGLPPIGSAMLFAPLLTIFRTRYPGIEIQLVEHGSKRLTEMVLAGELELAASLLPLSDALEWQDVRRDPVDALLPSNHALATRGSLRMADLAQVPFIMFEAGFALNPILLSVCERSGFTPSVAIYTSQVDFVLGLVAAGLGVGFLPRMIAAQRGHAGVRAVPVADAGMDWHMALSWRRGGYLSQAATAWLALVRERTSKQQEHHVRN